MVKPGDKNEKAKPAPNNGEANFTAENKMIRARIEQLFSELSALAQEVRKRPGMQSELNQMLETLAKQETKISSLDKDKVAELEEELQKLEERTQELIDEMKEEERLYREEEAPDAVDYSKEDSQERRQRLLKFGKDLKEIVDFFEQGANNDAEKIFLQSAIELLEEGKKLDITAMNHPLAKQLPDDWFVDVDAFVNKAKQLYTKFSTYKFEYAKKIVPGEPKPKEPVKQEAPTKESETPASTGAEAAKEVPAYLKLAAEVERMGLELKEALDSPKAPAVKKNAIRLVLEMANKPGNVISRVKDNNKWVKAAQNWLSLARTALEEQAPAVPAPADAKAASNNEKNKAKSDSLLFNKLVRHLHEKFSDLLKSDKALIKRLKGLKKLFGYPEFDGEFVSLLKDLGVNPDDVKKIVIKESDRKDKREEKEKGKKKDYKFEIKGARRILRDAVKLINDPEKAKPYRKLIGQLGEFSEIFNALRKDKLTDQKRQELQQKRKDLLHKKPDGIFTQDAQNSDLLENAKRIIASAAGAVQPKPGKSPSAVKTTGAASTPAPAKTPDARTVAAPSAPRAPSLAPRVDTGSASAAAVDTAPPAPPPPTPPDTAPREPEPEPEPEPRPVKKIIDIKETALLELMKPHKLQEVVNQLIQGNAAVAETLFSNIFARDDVDLERLREVVGQDGYTSEEFKNLWLEQLHKRPFRMIKDNLEQMTRNFIAQNTGKIEKIIQKLPAAKAIILQALPYLAIAGAGFFAALTGGGIIGLTAAGAASGLWRGISKKVEGVRGWISKKTKQFKQKGDEREAYKEKEQREGLLLMRDLMAQFNNNQELLSQLSSMISQGLRESSAQERAESLGKDRNTIIANAELAIGQIKEKSEEEYRHGIGRKGEADARLDKESQGRRAEALIMKLYESNEMEDLIQEALQKDPKFIRVLKGINALKSLDLDELVESATGRRADVAKKESTLKKVACILASGIAGGAVAYGLSAHNAWRPVVAGLVGAYLGARFGHHREIKARQREFAAEFERNVDEAEQVIIEYEAVTDLAAWLGADGEEKIRQLQNRARKLRTPLTLGMLDDNKPLKYRAQNALRRVEAIWLTIYLNNSDIGITRRTFDPAVEGPEGASERDVHTDSAVENLLTVLDREVEILTEDQKEVKETLTKKPGWWKTFAWSLAGAGGAGLLAYEIQGWRESGKKLDEAGFMPQEEPPASGGRGDAAGAADTARAAKGQIKPLPGEIEFHPPTATEKSRVFLENMGAKPGAGNKFTIELGKGETPANKSEFFRLLALNGMKGKVLGDDGVLSPLEQGKVLNVGRNMLELAGGAKARGGLPLADFKEHFSMKGNKVTITDFDKFQEKIIGKLSAHADEKFTKQTMADTRAGKMTAIKYGARANWEKDFAKIGYEANAPREHFVVPEDVKDIKDEVVDPDAGKAPADAPEAQAATKPEQVFEVDRNVFGVEKHLELTNSETKIVDAAIRKMDWIANKTHLSGDGLENWSKAFGTMDDAMDRLQTNLHDPDSLAKLKYIGSLSAAELSKTPDTKFAAIIDNIKGGSKGGGGGADEIVQKGGKAKVAAVEAAEPKASEWIAGHKAAEYQEFVDRVKGGRDLFVKRMIKTSGISEGKLDELLQKFARGHKGINLTNAETEEKFRTWLAMELEESGTASAAVTEKLSTANPVAIGEAKGGQKLVQFLDNKGKTRSLEIAEKFEPKKGEKGIVSLVMDITDKNGTYQARQDGKFEMRMIGHKKMPVFVISKMEGEGSAAKDVEHIYAIKNNGREIVLQK
ncbi:hypothetical protein EPN28_01250 [Patescibacteria group bacterium]|nr:MAG: hypothetical protein EPN28_01250 [Patescibacteria group bacterium]